MSAPEVPRMLREGEAEGLWGWSEDVAVDRLEEIGAQLGWHTVVLDSSGASTKDEFLQACADAFALPSWFGMNWDALDECLADLDVGESTGVLVFWLGWDALAQAAPADFAQALDVLESAAGRWTADGVSGAVVAVGASAAGRFRELGSGGPVGSGDDEEP